LFSAGNISSSTMARGPHKSKAAKAKSIHRFRMKILKKKRKAVYETGG
ncbi:5026_t:CDS:2, partial [Rhizophagus irregularis]